MRNILLSISAIIVMLIMMFLISTNVNIDSNINNIDSNINNNVKNIKTKVNKDDYIVNKKNAHCEHKDNVFCSHLPLVMIDTCGGTIKKEETIWSNIKVINNKNGNNHIQDKPNIKTLAALKYRGNSSYAVFDKKQYRLEFYEDIESKKKNKISLMGMEKECDWVLNGPFLDRTLIRNNLLYHVSREIMDWAPDTRYCEVFLDGKYQGIYLMVESVKVSKNRIKLKDFGLISGENAYMLKRERAGTEENPVNSFGTYAGKTSHELSISYPVPPRLTNAQKQWITNDISEFEKVLYSSIFNDQQKGYSKYIDVDSFVDYYIINEFSMNSDAGYLSTYVYKDLQGKLKMAAWDFNNTFDNYQWTANTPNKFYVCDNNWYKRLFKDRNFTKKVSTRYHELRKGILSEEYLLNRVDKTVVYLGDAVDRNFKIWGYTFYENLLSKDKNGKCRDPKSYEEALKQLKTTIVERGKFLDENIETLYQYAVN